MSMSIATPTPRRATTGLVEGDHLDQPEFHARYETMPPGVKAELIDGVVYMPSPVSGGHGDSQSHVIVWLGFYAVETPGVQTSGELTVILGRRSEPQPDAVLRIRPECGGRSTINEGYLRGAPELIVEVARSSRFVDLGPKLADYARAGVPEYVVVALEPDEIHWFQRNAETLAAVEPGPDGVYRSVVFPGLWLDPHALLSGDLRRLRQVVDQGVATPEHTEFVARLAENRERRPIDS
jgi:Putative restriction endonuclease